MKNRKLFAALLSLVLAVMLPLTSLAATSMEFSMMPGEMILSESPSELRTPIVDLFKALSFRVLVGEETGSGMFSLMLSGQNALDVSFRTDENGIFVQTALLGDKALYFNKEDFADFMVNLMNQQGQSMTPEAEAEFRESLNTIFVSTAADMDALVAIDAYEAPAEPVDFSFDKEAAIAMVPQLYPDDPAMQNVVINILNSVVVTEGEFAVEGRDTANVCMTMSMKTEDFLLVMDSAVMEQSLAQYVASGNHTVEEAKAEMKAELENSDINFEMTFYYIKEGSQLVGMDMNMTAKEDKNDPESDSFGMVVTLDRLTTDVATYTIGLKADENGEPELGGKFVAVDDQNGKVTLDGSFFEYDDNGAAYEDEMLIGGEFTTMNDVFYGWFSMVEVAYSEAITFAVASQPTSDGVNFTLDLYMRENAVAPVAPVASDQPMGTFALDVSENVSEDELAAINAATIENSLQPFEMTEEELEQFAESIQKNAQNVLFSILPLLPPSLFSLFLGQ
ncbi:MAG: hypothetical protein E7331_00570 [Clostridiales bacterium]|nr:hypothetical protein [Clostridiales bacterium]